jgi:hypothetical protein
MNRIRSEPRLPRSGNAALAAGALIQAALGGVFVIAGLSKLVAANYTQQFRTFVQGSEGATSGPLSIVVQVLVVPNIDVVANLTRFTELAAGFVLMLGAFEVARRRLSGPFGGQRGYEPLVALISAVAAFVLGGLSLSIYVLDGGGLPSISPDLAFVSPVAVELLIVPLAVGIGWLEFGRFVALRSTPPQSARV